MEPLSPRQQSILNRVVDTYIETSQPVGSRSITGLYTEIYRDSYSPATVRHEMGILEEQGYLTHPHTSAGRVPTDLGYRFYVDNGIPFGANSRDLLRSYADELKAAADEKETLAERVSSLLSKMAEEVGVTLFPQSDASRKGGRRFKLFLEGISRILEKPEFQNVGKARPLLKALEEKIELGDWLDQRPASREISISIGQENCSEAFHDCAVISARYVIGGEPVGVLAVIGPRRMRYGLIVPLVEQMAELISGILKEMDPA